jgi:ABC-type polysaccharide/polyol phosphate export permease
MIRRFSELYSYRELMRNLVIRDLKVRYKNSALGVLWSLLNPLLMTVVFTVVFTVMLPNYQVANYPVFFLCGFLPWGFLSASLVAGTGLALILSTANVFYRDTQHILEVLMQAWFFLTPIFYPITILPEQKVVLGLTINVQLWLRRLNPMASLVASYQDVLYWGAPTGLDFLVRTLATCALVLVIGYALFCRYSSLFGEEA